ncbi:hypothetical protein TNCV_728361 [Trichonephila clavipes]|nr:hypothetical protein TNCV_728361 [Trichonephila clavipes]
MCKAIKRYRERKLLSGIDVSKKAGKVSITNALDVCRHLAPLKTSKNFLRRNLPTKWCYSISASALINQSPNSMIAKNDANLALSPTFRYVSIESSL